jgi:hypothetical protein
VWSHLTPNLDVASHIMSGNWRRTSQRLDIGGFAINNATLFTVASSV